MEDEFEKLLDALRLVRSRHSDSHDRRVRKAVALLGPMIEIIEGEGNGNSPIGRREDG